MHFVLCVYSKPIIHSPIFMKWAIIWERTITSNKQHSRAQRSWSDWQFNTWSAGWRWDDSSASPRNGYCSLMSYDSGYPDAKTYYRVAYFSNPDIYYQGQVTGDSADGNNAGTLREIRNIIAGYRPTATAPECTIDADCTGGQVCFNNECVECADDGDCTGGTCESNVCIPYECTIDDDCTGEEVCANNICVECANNSDCDGGDVCSNNTCVECADNSDCTAMMFAQTIPALSAQRMVTVSMAHVRAMSVYLMNARLTATAPEVRSAQTIPALSASMIRLHWW